MDQLLSPILLYGACALGAIGVALSLPKKSFSPFIVGGLVAAGALGLLAVGLFLKTPPTDRPNVLFYVFALIALGASLRVITHPRPVYAALYFILTILASSGLYLLLAAEFMAFALVIVYAGAILITYLFVIMLATETPSAEEIDVLNDYDRVAREPVVATLAGFILLAALTSILAGGAVKLKADPRLATYGDAGLANLPRKVETLLREARASDGKPLLASGEKVTAVDAGPQGIVTVRSADGATTRTIPRSQWPRTVTLDNVEGVAFTLIGGHPGSIEIAGIILLMAMLGAVVLARKKVDLDEAAKHDALNVLGHHVPAGSAAPSAGGAA
ncbi:MAG: NADH-quinone oxidoreductase subunit J [Phycisphaerales bacterium]